MGIISLGPTEGEKNQEVDVTGSCNDGLDIVKRYRVYTAIGGAEKEFSVTLKGKREEFLVDDGNGNMAPYLTSDGSEYAVLKDEWKDNPTCLILGSLTGFDQSLSNPAMQGRTGDEEPDVTWDYYLIDTTQNTGITISPVGKLKKNNFFRFEDGSFAPAVGITEAQRAECDVALYLDSAATSKYCDAGQFNAESFYNAHGMAKLYNSSGAEVRVLRPWETTETKYSIMGAFSKEVVVVDNIVGTDGLSYRGVATENAEIGAVDLQDEIRCPRLPRTAISPSPPCTIGNKYRSFFFNYVGETYCQSYKGLENYCEIAYKKGTYPRTGNVSAISNVTYARNNNADKTKPYPFSEGGYLSLNAFVLYLESKYGTKALAHPDLFGNGISSYHRARTEDAWRSYGGVRFRDPSTGEWVYDYHAYNAATDRDWHYNTTGGVGYLWYLSVGEGPMEFCMESQIVASYIKERNIAPDTEFELYGYTYYYKNITGLTPTLDDNSEMCLKIFKYMPGGKMNPYDSEGNRVGEIDVEIMARMSLYEGFNLSGDIFRYWNGGIEVVGDAEHTTTNTTGFNIRIYIEPNQLRYHNETVYHKTGTYDFEDKYMLLYEGTVVGNGYAKSRIPLTPWRAESGGGFNTYDCFYNYQNQCWNSWVERVLVGLRFGGYAFSSSCSPRYVHANNYAGYSSRSSAGSVQCLLA